VTCMAKILLKYSGSKIQLMCYIWHACIGNGEAHDLSYQKENTKTKKGYICWNEYLHRMFLGALEILGEG